MNKYLEELNNALNNLKKYSDSYDEVGNDMYPYEYSKRYKNSIDTLQELIDKQQEYIYQFDKYEQQHQEMFEKMCLLEKALDKACEELTKHGRDCVCCNIENCAGGYELEPKCEDINFWKEYLLKGDDNE